VIRGVLSACETIVTSPPRTQRELPSAVDLFTNCR
jgi:hypothetical protein